MVLNKKEVEIERLMSEGQAAVKRGDKAMSRTLLTQLLELEPHNEQAWMWLSGAVTDLTEQQTCLENVLIINPDNSQARKGLDYIRAKSSKATSAALDSFSGPLFEMDEPVQPPTGPMANNGVAPTQPNAANVPTSHAQTAVTPTEQAHREDVSSTNATTEPVQNEQPSDAHVTPTQAVQADAPDFTQASPTGATVTPHPEETVATVAPDDSELPTYTGGPPTEGTPPDTSKAMPDWVHTLASENAAENIESSSSSSESQQTLHQAADENWAESPSIDGIASTQADATLGNEIDLNAWLDDLAASAPSDFEGHQSEMDEATAHLGASSTEQLAPFGPFPVETLSDPGMSFPPAGPFTANQLPSPDDLPGLHTGELVQPWYLQTSSESVATLPDQALHMEQSAEAKVGAVHTTEAVPISTIECPNCQNYVAETSLVCPECRYSFFVHCPHCHELVDTSTAKPGVVEPCPYCSVEISKMDLGLSNITGSIAPHGSAPKETEKSWVGEGLVRPSQRSGFLLTFGWVVDLVWLMLIALMVWALTQLPAWWHLTNLYN